MTMGGGIGMGNTCKSTADSCQCMTKTTKKKKRTYVSIITLNVNELNAPTKRQ